jgi:hypothetical protein
MKPHAALPAIAMQALRALCALAMLCALPAQSQPAAPPDCPKAAEVTQPQMLGLWRAEFGAGVQGATMLLENNANYPDSFAGAINRNGAMARVAGDVDEGEFTMEESIDGLHIAATWIGDVVEGSCGREIRGTWQAEGDKLTRSFIMRKLP